MNKTRLSIPVKNSCAAHLCHTSHGVHSLSHLIRKYTLATHPRKIWRQSATIVFRAANLKAANNHIYPPWRFSPRFHPHLKSWNSLYKRRHPLMPSSQLPPSPPHPNTSTFHLSTHVDALLFNYQFAVVLSLNLLWSVSCSEVRRKRRSLTFDCC